MQPADPTKLKAAMKAAAQAHRAWDTKGTEFDLILKKKNESSESTLGAKPEKGAQRIEQDRKIGPCKAAVRIR